MRDGVRNAIDRYLSRIPGADSARTFDPVYAAQMTYLQRVLETVDMAMEDEGVPESTRVRVIRTVVYGAPDEYAAHERMARTEELKEWAMRVPGPLPPSDAIWQPGMPRRPT